MDALILLVFPTCFETHMLPLHALFEISQDDAVKLGPFGQSCYKDVSQKNRY